MKNSEVTGGEKNGQLDVISLFNTKPHENIEGLCRHFRMEPTPRNIAHLLHSIKGLNGQQIGNFLARRGSEDILNEYFMKIDLMKPFIDALRVALGGPMVLPGEAQMIDRIIMSFGSCYLRQNPGSFSSEDIPVFLAYALIMLNSDLHSSHVREKMSAEDFKRNVKGSIPQGNLITDSTIDQMYQSVQRNPIIFGISSSN